MELAKSVNERKETNVSVTNYSDHCYIMLSALEFGENGSTDVQNVLSKHRRRWSRTMFVRRFSNEKQGI